jgi:hypothetical protein
VQHTDAFIALGSITDAIARGRHGVGTYRGILHKGEPCSNNQMEFSVASNTPSQERTELQLQKESTKRDVVLAGKGTGSPEFGQRRAMEWEQLTDLWTVVLKTYSSR